MNGEKYTMQILTERKQLAILISEGADFKVRRIIRNKGHNIMIKCQVFKKTNNSYCVCVCQTIEHQNYMREKLIELQGGKDESSVIVGRLQYPPVRNGLIQWAENLYRQR